MKSENVMFTTRILNWDINKEFEGSEIRWRSGAGLQKNGKTGKFCAYPDSRETMWIVWVLSEKTYKCWNNRGKFV